MDFTIHFSDQMALSDSILSVQTHRLIGFNINIVSEVHLFKYLDLRFLPGLNFGQRNMEYVFYNEHENTTERHTMYIESTHLDLPVLLKYSSARLNNYRLYLVGGGAFRYDWAAQKEIQDIEKPKITLKPWDAYYEIGAGIDFFLEYFKFSIETKLSVGLNNIISSDNYESMIIRKMNSKIFFISLHFEGGKYYQGFKTLFFKNK